MHLWDGGDVETRDSSFLKCVLLVQDLLIHLCHNLLIHQSLLIFHTLIQTLENQERDRTEQCALVHICFAYSENSTLSIKINILLHFVDYLVT